jgi:hypothetical protein
MDHASKVDAAIADRWYSGKDSDGRRICFDLSEVTYYGESSMGGLCVHLKSSAGPTYVATTFEAFSLRLVRFLRSQQKA